MLGSDFVAFNGGHMLFDFCDDLFGVRSTASRGYKRLLFRCRYWLAGRYIFCFSHVANGGVCFGYDGNAFRSGFKPSVVFLKSLFCGDDLGIDYRVFRKLDQFQVTWRSTLATRKSGSPGICQQV